MYFAMEEALLRNCSDDVLNVVETRLYRLRELEEINGKEGEVALRQSMQMCQWISLLEPFIPEADLLLESLLEVTNAIASEAEQSVLRRKGRPHIPILKNKYDFLLNTTLKLFKLLNCLGAPEEP